MSDLQCQIEELDLPEVSVIADITVKMRSKPLESASNSTI